MSQVDKNIVQIVVGAIEYQVGVFFKEIYLQILGVFALMMLVFAAEILIYHLWWKKRYVKVAAISEEV